MLKEASWLPKALALDLPEGRSVRVDHDCGSGRTLKLSREGAWLWAWCHRCNDKGSHHVQEALAVRIARLAQSRQADVAAATGASIPDGSLDPITWPRDARLWFAKAGMHSGDIGRLGARYDARTRRVVIPCGPSFWIARAIFPGQSPKYLAPSVGRSDVLLRYGDASTITLTEDVLSAYKVGKVTEAWPMLGTSPSHKLIAELLKTGKPVKVWLDNDLPPKHTTNRGQIAAAKTMKTLRGMGVTCTNIVSPKDPKQMTLDEIKELTS